MSTRDAHDDDALERVLELSRAMAEQARDGAWETLAELEAQRRPLLARLFDPAARAGGPLTGHARAAAQAILAKDREIMALAGAAREDLGRRLQHLTRGRQASAAYRDHHQP